MTGVPPPAPETLDTAERMSRSELEALQLTRLQATLCRVYSKVPAYRAKFDAAGVRPEDCAALPDLADFPTTTKDDLRENYPLGMLAVPRERLSRIHASSGTTGRATIVAYTAHDIDVWSELVARSIRAAGGHAGQTVHVAYGYGLFTGGLGAHYGAERLGCTVIPASGGQTARQVELIRDLGPQIIMLTPTYMLTLLEEFDRQGIDPRESSLTTGIFGAEPWTDAMRAEIEARAGIDALDIYGLSEAIGPGVASECVETKDGPTVWEDHFYPEVIDPETGAVLPDGEYGELVLTSLTKEAMPVVRYRTRDLTRLLPGTARPMRRMERITGRSDDLIILRGVNLFPSRIEELVLATAGLSPHFQLVRRTRGRMETLTVRVEARPDCSTERRLEAAEELLSAVRDGVGVSVVVDVLDPQSLSRSVGKFPRVLDERSEST